MLRLTRSDSGTTSTLRVEGRLTREELAGFEAACAECLVERGSLALDLAGLHFVDREAAANLRTLRLRGVELRGLSGFIDKLLEDEGPL